MTISDDFHFTQSNLQDYVECRRRFQLRYLLGLAWPAVEAEPALENERHRHIGALFHRLLQQHLLGLPSESLSPAAAADPELRRWWGNYLKYGQDLKGLKDLSGLQIYPEMTLSAPLNDYRLAAKYDLVALVPGKLAVIFDWKTFRVRPQRQHLIERLQTRLYPFLLVKAGAHINDGRSIRPDQVEMVYWYPKFPAKPEIFPYSQLQYEEDGKYMAVLVKEIAGLQDDDFTLTSKVERCRFCTYRSLCDRGVQAGSLTESPADPEAGFDEEGPQFTLDFEQIAEIEF